MVKYDKKLEEIEKIVEKDCANGRTLKQKITKKIIKSGKNPKDFFKELESIAEIK